VIIVATSWKPLNATRTFTAGRRYKVYKQISAIRGVRHIDRIEVPGTQETSEVCGIASIGLDAITRLLGDQRGGHDQAFHTELLETSGKDKTAGASVDGCYRPPGCTRCSLSRSARL